MNETMPRTPVVSGAGWGAGWQGQDSALACERRV